MMYTHNKNEAKWQSFWKKNNTYQTETNSNKKKYYVLDMFPYPSGAGLHVGHPLGYIASDIFSRYKRQQGFNVLHPMGYDAFGLPAEQYAIQTGQHPAITTEANLKRYREQLDRMGFSFDWNREIRTCEPNYYKWTQWIFIQLFDSWYNKANNKAEAISALISQFENKGNTGIKAACDENTPTFSAQEWTAYSEAEKEKILLDYRLTYLAKTEVNWCPKLGTVLANDEIINGLSERGGFPVEKKKMLQWSMRISAYAQRLLDGLEGLDWSDSIKETQRNWIGKSKGVSLSFNIENQEEKIEVFTTRPDTIFGVSFLSLAPEHDLVNKITTSEQKEAVSTYVKSANKKSDRERMADVKTITGVFTGAYAQHPFTGKNIPIWIGDYVLSGYGTGAVMAVPAGDSRDYAFAKHFDIEIPAIFEGIDISEQAYEEKKATLYNSDFLNGLSVKKATETIINAIQEKELGKGKTNYRLRDAVFSRQRYWGEPFPIYYKNGLPQTIATEHLPIILPEVENYLPTKIGEPPLGNADVWAWDSANNQVVENIKIDHETVFPLELNTMPGWAGSSWYFLRYMDSQNDKEAFGKEAVNYWKNVDLYLGGSEHATGHLLYSRFWHKFLFDKGLVPTQEYAQKLVNQGMILGESAFVYRAEIIGYEGPPIFIPKKLAAFYSEGKDGLSELKEWNSHLFHSISKILNIEPSSLEMTGSTKIHVDISFLNKRNELDLDAFRQWRPDFTDAKFILEEGQNGEVYICGREVEKMSKSKYNVVNPDDICDQYGADTLRMYEMFLGPIEQDKPWNTQGLSGVSGFINKYWRLFFTDETFTVSQEEPSKEEYKILHSCIKKVTADIESFSFNTSISTFMITVNELTKAKCNKQTILEPLTQLLAPFAPHITEETYQLMGNTSSVHLNNFPKFEEKYLVEENKTYPVSFNGKKRFTLDLPLTLSQEEIEKIVMADERTQQQLDGRTPKKVIIVPGKIINIVG